MRNYAGTRRSIAALVQCKSFQYSFLLLQSCILAWERGIFKM